jgi:hypothetical protein
MLPKLNVSIELVYLRRIGVNQMNFNYGRILSISAFEYYLFIYSSHFPVNIINYI